MDKTEIFIPQPRASLLTSSGKGRLCRRGCADPTEEERTRVPSRGAARPPAPSHASRRHGCAPGAGAQLQFGNQPRAGGEQPCAADPVHPPRARFLAATPGPASLRSVVQDTVVLTESHCSCDDVENAEIHTPQVEGCVAAVCCTCQRKTFLLRAYTQTEQWLFCTNFWSVCHFFACLSVLTCN